GYEWNKYTQANQNTDNPPPKGVQGYKIGRIFFNIFYLNIFYPDLIDKTKAPTYKIVKEDGNDDTLVLLL
ncbi:hypothetical protein B0H13DRAFT_1509312, partial [Mycena leptocephala]